MARFSLQNTFRLGQVSRKYATRDDLGIHSNAVEIMRNVIPHPSGGFSRRPGTLQTDDLNDTSLGTGNLSIREFQTIPFVFSEDEAYTVILAAGAPGGVRVRKDLTSALITPTMTNTPSLDLSERLVQYAQSGDTLIITHPDTRPMKLVRTSANTFTMSYYVPDANTNAAVLAFPYRKVNITSLTMTPSNTSGSNRTLTASSSFFNSGHVGAMFKVTHAGTTGVCRVIGFTSATVVQVDIIINFGATTASTNWQESAWSDYRGWPGSVCFGDGRLFFGGNTADPDRVWASVNNNYNIFMQNKLAQDSASDASGLNYFGDVADSDAYDFGPGAGEVNRIAWLAYGRSFMMGTEGGPFAVYPGTSGTAMSVGNTRLVAVSGYACAPIQPALVGQDIVFVTRDRQALIRVTYDDNYGRYKDVNLNALNDKIAFERFADFIDQEDEPSAYIGIAGFGQIAYDSDRRTIWAVAGFGSVNYFSGQLVGVTLSEEGGLVAWHEHVLGGDPLDEGRATGTDVISLCVTPSSMLGDEYGAGSGPNVKTKNLLWLHTGRKLPTGYNGLLSDFYPALEVMTPLVDRKRVGVKTTKAIMQNLYLDGARVFSNFPAATDTFAIGTDFEGDVMQVIADDLVLDDVTIDSSGNAVISREASYVQIGFKFTPVIKGFPFIAGGVIGSVHGEIRRADKVRLELYRSLGVYVGASEDAELEEVQFRTPDDPMDEQTPLFTGTKTLDFDGDYDTDPYVYLEQRDPLPFTLSCWVVKGQTNEE